MYISAKSDYALRALITLAAEGRPLTADELASRQDLPGNFLAAILLDLRHAGIVTTRRGRDAGYRFLRDPDQLTAADVMRALEGPTRRGARNAARGGELSSGGGTLQQLWIALRASLRVVLEGVTIGQLARGELPGPLQQLVDAPDSWRSR